MITEKIVDILGTIFSWFLGLLPDVGVPSWLESYGVAFQALTGFGVHLGNWFPFGLMSGVIGSVLAAWAVGLIIKIVRIGFSAFSGGGGGAA